MKSQNPTSAHTAIPITTDFRTNEDWRFEKPCWDTDKCVRCGVCYLLCPDGAIFEDGSGFYDVDPTYCKGCGICARQCTTGCIRLEPCAARPPWLAR